MEVIRPGKILPFIAKWWALSRNEVHAPAVNALAAPAVHALTALADYSAAHHEVADADLLHTPPWEPIMSPWWQIETKQKRRRKRKKKERKKNRYIREKIQLFRINAGMRANTRQTYMVWKIPKIYAHWPYIIDTQETNNYCPRDIAMISDNVHAQKAYVPKANIKGIITHIKFMNSIWETWRSTNHFICFKCNIWWSRMINQ